MSGLRRTVTRLAAGARERRALVFRDHFALTESTRLLDLGSENGSNIHAVLRGTTVKAENTFIADIDGRAIAEGSRRYGYRPVMLDESGVLPFPDQYFDIVYCSSVIEHVTVPKSEVWECRSGRRFVALARQRQRAFAKEIMRVGRQYFVQTPNRGFVVESHSWLPFAGWIPRELLVPLLRLSNGVWIKKTSPDWHLLDRMELTELFGSARIVTEKWCGLTKSLMAIRSDAGRAT